MTADWWCQERLASPSCPAEGCRHCGTRKREHPWLWCRGLGYHQYAAPDRELIRQRMRRRYGLTP